MFRDDEQRSAVCTALLASVGLEHLWQMTGPTAEAREFVQAGGAHLSGQERRMLLLVWELWTEETALPIHELLELAPNLLKMVGTLFAAMGDDQIDRWIQISRK